MWITYIEAVPKLQLLYGLIAWWAEESLPSPARPPGHPWPQQFADEQVCRCSHEQGGGEEVTENEDECDAYYSRDTIGVGQAPG